MTEQFASIELARLYESQGYIDDALTMYRALSLEDGDVGLVSEVQKAVARLEEIKAAAGPDDATGKAVADTTIREMDASPVPGGMDETGGGSKIETENEKHIAVLLEKWLMLMVVQKRVNVFKAIRARL